ncbi:vacuolar protein 8-like [Chanos chanos]|uniref:Vacuolar protein 8 n=1 Tax=Chanos chanos TaxID=29144 RepID=A0A6J2WMY2_CHACN|nr:vacuolar protein 8-like [Chanos chanos]
MGLCKKCAQLLEDFNVLVKRAAADFVQRFKECVKRISQCCCTRTSSASKKATYHHPLLQPHERRAAQKLTQCIDTGSETALLSNDCLRALKVSSASENNELQQSAAAYYLHLSQHITAPLPVSYLEPYRTLFRSSDLEVQRVTSLSLVNLLMEGKIKNELVIEMDFLEPLQDMLQSGDPTIQYNSCACIALLASSDSNREAIVSSDCVLPLLVLAKSLDTRVQQNAVRALLNLTESENTMRALCEEGVIPVLAILLLSTDSEVQFYSCCALNKIAAVPKYHPRMLCIGDHFLLKSLISLMSSSVQRNSSQACQCLWSLSKNVNAQQQLMDLNCVSVLLELLGSPALSLSESAGMLLSELSSCPTNRESLVNECLLQNVGEVLFRCQSSTAVMRHCTIIITNLCSISSGQQALMDSDCLSGLLKALESDFITDESLLCVLSCLHYLAGLDALRSHVQTNITSGHIASLVRLSDQMANADLSFAAASVVSKLETEGRVAQLLLPHQSSITAFILRFLRSQEVKLQQLGIVTVCNLKKGGVFESVTCGKELENELFRLQQQTEQTRQLLQMVDLPSAGPTDTWVPKNKH